MEEYKIEVKPWMLKKSSEDFDFMKKWNNDIPMPLLIMYGTKIGESPKMTKFRLHGDIQQRITTTCMCCGRPITNPVSQYFGIGPVCGGHNYTNPFSSEEELNKAVAAYRQKLIQTTWIGWVSNNAIISIDDDTDIFRKLADMPFEVTADSEYCFEDAEEPVSRSQRKLAPFVVAARIAKPVKGTDDYSVFISFKYNVAIKEAVKSLSTHIWDNNTKEWEIDYKDFQLLKHKLDDMNCTLSVSSEVVIPDKVGIPSDFEFKTKPMKHQIEGIKFGLEHNRFLLADSMGLGKTKEALDCATIRKKHGQIKHCLVVCCVNSLKWNWIEEIEKHTNETGWILGMHQMKRAKRWTVGGNKEKLADIDKLINGDPELDSKFFIITNIESLRNPEIAEKLAMLCESNTIGMVATDECHRCKDTRTQQASGLLQLQPTYRIAMSGTPLINTPTDLFAILKWLGYQRYGFKSFRDHFCELGQYNDIVGYKNIDQLVSQLDSIMIRRIKEEVLADLPEKIYINEYIELTDEQKHLYNQVIDKVIEDPDLADQLSLDCQLAVKTRLRQVSGGIEPFTLQKKNPKLDRMAELIEEAVHSGTKVIVFSNWVKAIKPAIKRLQQSNHNYNPVVISGEIRPEDRQQIIHKFQTDDSVKVIFCTIAAAGVGITLTAASEVIFLDEPFTNAEKEQAIDRAHRIGTKSAVTVHTIMGHSTYDENVHDIILGKRDLSDAIVDKNALAMMKIL
jgi:SNF2 family DNA or RNA helicase